MPAKAWKTTELELETGEDRNEAEEGYIVTDTADPYEAILAVRQIAPATQFGYSVTGVRPQYLGAQVWRVFVDYSVSDSGGDTAGGIGSIDPAGVGGGVAGTGNGIGSNLDQVGPPLGDFPTGPGSPSGSGDPANSEGQQPQEPGGDDPLGPEYSASISAGTTHIGISIATRAVERRVLPDGNVVPRPDTRRVIGINSDGTVQGTDVPSPVMEWSITYPVAVLTLNYLRQVRSCVGKTNEKPFYGWDSEELMFLGMEVGNKKPGKGWPCTYKFAAGENKRDVDFAGDGSLPVAEINAFDHVWVMYRDEKVGDYIIPVPSVVFVEQVAEVRDFRAILKI